MMEVTKQTKEILSPSLKSIFKKSSQSPYWFVLPYASLFILIIVLPVIVAIILSFFSFDPPKHDKFLLTFCFSTDLPGFYLKNLFNDSIRCIKL